VTNKIIPEIKKDHDNDLTKEEIDLIGSHLDKEIEDLNQHIDNEKWTKIRKQIRLKRTKIKQYKKQIKDYSERKHKYDVQKSILKGRHSYSKIDHDATFMRMKEDYMKKWTTQTRVSFANSDKFSICFILSCVSKSD